ncbi:hypothetical protein C491_17197 [Natronococcus amylolyticus DSM 10524]|uniref:Uncharacterized protein n=1 Tax=Natronococcus amylolyticus DSM 10524 TaxID=1227497 RepID=L9X1Y5_9EURY|nr:hypothetical protein C491_17197 [Natronococcus amylolyticus DSM 10524]
MIIAVADAGPTIHPDEINALGLLSTIDRVLIPQATSDELAAGMVSPALSDTESELVEADTPTAAVRVTSRNDPPHTRRPHRRSHSNNRVA